MAPPPKLALSSGPMRFMCFAILAIGLTGCGSDDSGGGGSGGSGGGNSGPWRRDADLPTAVTGAAAAELGGKIWVAGGVVGGAVSNGVNVYDPATDTWSAGPELPAARAQAAMTSVGGDLYVIGGFSDVDASPADSIYVLPAGATTWEKRSSLLLNRAAGYAATFDDGVYVFGGAGDSKLLGDTVVFDPGANSWSVKAAIPSPRQAFAGFVLSGLVYAVGGTTDSGGVTNKVDVYDPKANSWSAGPEFPIPRDDFGAATLDGKAYVAGSDSVGTVDVFDGTNWSSGPTLPSPRSGVAVVAAAGRVYVIGGELVSGGGGITLESYAP